MNRFKLEFCLVAALLVGNPVFGDSNRIDEQHRQTTHGEKDTSHGQDTHDHGHHFHRHHIGFFLGSTYGKVHVDEHRAAESHSERVNSFTYGVDYEFRLTQVFGIGAGIDYAAGDLRSLVFSPTVFIHPIQQLKIPLSLGLDRHDGHNQVVFRTGLLYEIPIQRFMISPTFAVDFLEGDTLLLYGVTLGVGF